MLSKYNILLGIFILQIYFVVGDVVTTKSGRLNGTITKSWTGQQFHAFYGIPYAQPPIGKLRFEPPLPVQSWNGIRSAAAYGPICWQPIWQNNLPEMGEDCLTLNIFTKNFPLKMNAGLKPVVVFIHGGGFQTGSASLEAGPRYLMDRDIVYVNMNYRLGALGFLATGTKASPGNVGLKDQVLALKWIHANIRYFGGDPNKITISGMSAGGFSVTSLMVSPMARNLFHGVITHSGAVTSAMGIKHHDLTSATFIAKRLGCTSENPDEFVECLKTKSAEDIVNVMYENVPFCTSISWRPVIEPDFKQERFLTEDPNESFRNGRFQKIPVIAGITANEFAGAVLATARPSIQHCHVPVRTFQRSRSEQRPLPIIPLESEPIRRDPSRQYSTHHNRRQNRVRIQSPVNNSSTTSDSDNTNENGRRQNNFQSLVKDAFCPDLLQPCPAQTAYSSSSSSSSDTQRPQLEQLPPDEDYVEIDEIRHTVSTLNIDNNNDPFNTNSTNFPHHFIEENATCIAPIEPLKQAMGQSLSQRRPKISLTWVLRGEQQPANPSALLHVDGTENRTREKKKFRSKSKDTGERLFSEKYVTGLEKIGDASLNNNRPRAVSELLYVCSKNAGECSSVDLNGYASDHCGNRNERCRKSDKPKNSSKFSMIKNNLNNFTHEKSDHFKDKTIVLNGETGFRNDVTGDYIKPTYSEPSLCTEGQSRRHRHRRRRNRSQRFGYEIRNVDEFLSKCSLTSPGNIPVVLSSSSTLYQTKPGGYQIEIPLPLGMVVNAVFKNQNWLYVQTPHAEEGYVCYKYIMPLGIIPHMRSTSTIKPPPCWETSGDVFPKPCGNMTDSEKEIQLRGGTRSEGARTPRLRRTAKRCGERNVDLLYLRAASQPKLQEKSYAQLKSTSKMCKSTTASSEKANDDYVLLQHKKPPIYPQNQQNNHFKSVTNTRSNGTRSLRQTLLAVTENFVSTAISVKKGDVVTLLACKEIQDKRLQQPIQWFFVRSRDGQEGFIPAEVAGHGFL